MPYICEEMTSLFSIFVIYFLFCFIFRSCSAKKFVNIASSVVVQDEQSYPCDTGKQGGINKLFTVSNLRFLCL